MPRVPSTGISIGLYWLPEQVQSAIDYKDQLAASGDENGDALSVLSRTCSVRRKAGIHL
jgi:hypothetical protein